MNWLLPYVLLAQIQRFDGLRNRFSGPRARFGLEDALTGIAVVIAVAVVLYFVNRWHIRHSGHRSYNSPRALFRELCHAHKLDRHERKLLRSVARWQRLAQPARLFLEPERFEPANLSRELERQSSLLFELRSKLFTFEVTPESRDSMPSDLADGKTESPRNTISNLAEKTEAVGAAAFATTQLESAEQRSTAETG